MNKSAHGALMGRVSSVVIALCIGFPATAGADPVCHLTAAGDQRTLDVPIEDIADHLAHGDSPGSCKPPQVEVPYTCSTSDVHYEKLFVRAGATPPMKGTLQQAFSTVKAALEFAARQGIGAVEVQVAPGSYDPESATITRPTRIVGPGRNAQPAAELALSIDHRSTHELGIQGVLFRANGLEPGLTVRTNAPVGDPRGHTALCDVAYDQIVGHAVAQVGGSIVASDIEVRDTRRHPDASLRNALSGTAFIFGGGLGGDINALLEDAHVSGSEGSGIVAAGFAANVTLDKVAISGSQGCAGALYVTNAAGLFGVHVRIGGVRSADDPLAVEGLDFVAGEPVVLTGNRMFGVYALGTTVLAGNDTHVGLDDLVVRNTSRTGSEAEECGYDSPSNLAADRGADVAVNRFILDASALLGVRIGLYGTTVNLSNGTVSNNPIAANVQDPDYDVSALQDNVQYINNGVNLDTEVIPVPEPTQPFDSL